MVKATENGAVTISMELQLAEQTTVKWETVLVERILYVYLDGNLPKGSKEAFVSLLEYAEEVLHCTNVIACFSKKRSDRGLFYEGKLKRRMKSISVFQILLSEPSCSSDFE